jgi:hypothetical protein
MTVESFQLDVSHSQVAVFHASLSSPFNNWTELHVRQGFAWRKGSASFRTIADGRHAIDVIVQARRDVAPQAVRVIEVPFEVSDDGIVQVASISDEVSTCVPCDTYMLRFECFGPKDHVAPTIRLVFTPSRDPKFRIVRADDELSVMDELVVTAEPT